MFKKIIFTFSLILILLSPVFVFAQEGSTQPEKQIFKAKVIEVLEEQSFAHEDGSESVGQKLKVVGLKGEWKGKEIIFDGTQYDVIANSRYKVGDKVLVNVSLDGEGNEMYFITGYSREGVLYLLVFLFAFLIILIGRLKGLRAVLVLILSFLVILKFIIPQILAGGSPLLVSIIGSFFILLLLIYVTEGINRPATVAVVSILITLVITALLSVIFSGLARLTGFASEEAMFLIGAVGGGINMQGLLLAGIIIGALGVLDDVAISQVMMVKEIQTANLELSKMEVYKKSMKVGVSHLSSMANTLFLAYAGASLPLLVLFAVDTTQMSFGAIISSEAIATEIVRTFTGSIGLLLAVPISTILAVYFIKAREK